MLAYEVRQHAAMLLSHLSEANLTLGCAESCTGGWVASSIVAHEGASQTLLGSVTAYQNQVKTQLLGVSKDVLDRFGAVSEPCAAAMAQGVCALLGCDIGLATTGIAGPSGGTPEKPAGTVFVAVHGSFGTHVRHYEFRVGDRTIVREQTVLAVLRLALAQR